jgi:hypothetical protein
LKTFEQIKKELELEIEKFERNKKEEFNDLINLKYDLELIELTTLEDKYINLMHGELEDLEKFEELERKISGNNHFYVDDEIKEIRKLIKLLEADFKKIEATLLS